MAEIFPDEGLDVILEIFPRGGTNLSILPYRFRRPENPFCVPSSGSRFVFQVTQNTELRKRYALFFLRPTRPFSPPVIPNCTPAPIAPSASHAMGIHSRPGAGSSG